MAASSTNYTCHYCGSHKLSVKKFLRHLSLQHEFLPDFSVSCHLCRKPYGKVESLRKHYYRKHQDVMVDQNHENDQNDVDVTDDIENVTDDIENEQVDHEETTLVCLDEVLKGLQKHITLFVLKVQEKHLLPYIVQDTVVGDVKFILEEFRQAFTDIVCHEIEQSMTVSEGSDLYDLLYRPDLLDTIFRTCSSTFRLQKYCKSDLGAIFPTECKLPVPINGKNISFQYVSILTTLKQILSTGDILGLIICEQMAPIHQDYFDYTSGTEFKCHPIFSQHRICLRLHLYIDEFEVVNPLGSNKSIYKLCGVYFTLGNLGPKFTTELRHIFLCILCRNIVLKDVNYSYQDILKPLIDDLAKLAT